MEIILIETQRQWVQESSQTSSQDFMDKIKYIKMSLKEFMIWILCETASNKLISSFILFFIRAC